MLDILGYFFHIDCPKTALNWKIMPSLFTVKKSGQGKNEYDSLSPNCLAGVCCPFIFHHYCHLLFLFWLSFDLSYSQVSTLVDGGYVDVGASG